MSIATDVNGKTYLVKSTSRLLFGYFNSLQISEITDRFEYLFFKKDDTLMTGVLTQDIERITNALTSELKNDMHDKSLFKIEEITDGVWCGRTWQMDNYYIQLNYEEKLYLKLTLFRNPFS